MGVATRGDRRNYLVMVMSELAHGCPHPTVTLRKCCRMLPLGDLGSQAVCGIS